MNCILISPTGREEFQNISSIHLTAMTGEMEILSGHIPVVSALKSGPALKLRAGDKVLRFTLAPGSFIRFENDSAEVLSAQYSFETEQAEG
ncbi:MAG: hypothetical protein LBC99_04590 [Spirochaetota bacterium]|jgi:F0F1-type ATP synthase epsilon subunit|nr:hypothetical protein [Spirochaetota bacterium]